MTSDTRVVPDRVNARSKGVGRPARLDRAMIAQATGEIGIASVTMRRVADHLAVSVPALYHYVSGRDELLRMAAEQSAAKLRLPEDHGQHWAQWLFEWADHARRAFVAEPEMLEQFLHGGYGLDQMIDHVDRVIGFLMQQGFSARGAFDAFFLISECAMGAAVLDIRERELAAGGHPVEAEYLRLLAHRAASELPHLRALHDDGSVRRPSFGDEAATVLAGIALRRGHGDDLEAALAVAGAPLP